MGRFICIHGHFYQPPRENPWIEEVEVEDSAFPYHDWNSRITAECYAPNTASRILDDKKSIVDIVNNYASISFNFGPTLLTWLEQHNPRIYSAILDADKESMTRFSGHGSALAQVYNHIIMPLADSRDKRTQVIWGIQDFRHRFGRSPEGMWLAETAVDLETLGILADQGILFTILSPSQASRIKKIGESAWTPVSMGTLDCSTPYLCQLPGNRSIAIFFFENNISQELAFGNLLENGGRFASRMMDYFSRTGKESGILTIAADGETFGHHHRFADMALAYALYNIEKDKPATITIFGEYLANHPPEYIVEIRENTSWSCPHGIERWRSNCGCCTRGTSVRDTEVLRRTRSAVKALPAKPPATCDLPGKQEWRAPLREIMDRLHEDLARIFEAHGSRYLKDPWGARDDYIAIILDRSPSSRGRFFEKHAQKSLTYDEKLHVLNLMEMERNALLMFTSCGWFFDEVSGIESIQVMKYACRAMQLAQEETGTNLEPDFLNALTRVKSNNPDYYDGSTIYLNFVKTSMIDLNRIVFNYVLTRMVTDSPKMGTIRHYTIVDESSEKAQSGVFRLVTGNLTLRSEITCKQKQLEYAVLHLGDYDFMGGVRDHSENNLYHQMQERLMAAIHQEDSSRLIAIMDQEFGSSTYSLWHLFKDARRHILSLILESTLTDLESTFRQIYRQHITLIHAMREMQVPVPQVFEEPVEYILNRDLNMALKEESVDIQKIRHLVSEMVRGQFAPEQKMLGFTASKKFTTLTRKMNSVPEDIRAMQEIVDLFTILEPLSLEYELWECQNDYFHTGKKQFAPMLQKAKKGDEQAVLWTKIFRQLGSCLSVRCQ